MPSFLSRLRAHALYGFPRPLLPPRSALEAMRAHSLPERLHSKPASVRWARYVLSVLGYPLVAVSASIQAFSAIRRRVPQISGMELVRIYSLAFLRNLPPTEYALYEFDREEVRARSADFLYWTDTPALLWLNRQRGADNRDVQDKARFAALCVQHGLPHAATLAEFRDGQQVDGKPVDELIETQLWVKPVDLNASRGAMGWTRDGESFRNDRGETFSREQWVGYLQRMNCIVQRWLRNHPELEPITNGALAGIRLNTVVDREGRAELIGAMLGLPFGAHKTTTGGIGGAVDPATGEIVRVLHLQLDLSQVHPDTRVPIVGRRVPLWNEAVELALYAHRTAFPRFASLGWDVVIAPEGPLLLETNSGWGAVAQQMYFGPLGQTALSRVVREELDRSR